MLSGYATTLQIMLPLAAFTDWLTGVSGALVFLATVGLGIVAVVQMVRLSRQARDDSQHLQDQIAASVAMGTAIKEAARAEVQPMVFAHPVLIVSGSGTHPEARNLSTTEVGFTYRVINEGTGLATNVRHGVQVGDISGEFGGGMPYRALRGAEQQPPDDVPPLMVPFQLGALPTDWRVRHHKYWAEFSNVFGDRFRTVIDGDPTKDAEFIRLPEQN